MLTFIILPRYPTANLEIRRYLYVVAKILECAFVMLRPEYIYAALLCSNRQASACYTYCKIQMLEAGILTESKLRFLCMV